MNIANLFKRKKEAEFVFVLPGRRKKVCRDKMGIREKLEMYRDLTQVLPAIAAERALSNKWEGHPMKGINYPGCKDEWATNFQEVSSRADKLFEEILTTLKETKKVKGGYSDLENMAGKEFLKWQREKNKSK